MTTHVISLIGRVALCVFRAVFQLWLKKTDPDVAEQSNKCEGCNGQCRDRVSNFHNRHKT